ncbi:MAG: bacillithiol system redox-active protein YtxJ [Candidatus Omnitrophota bacterium]|jgi:bacillithiol system protein YtxJ|nr:MAG: bacillithiol system redox-active protein YtxJ [Candidatus Omnitrophota bacterium]
MGFFKRNNVQAADIAYATFKAVGECVEASREKPVFIFKHSAICPISGAAKRAVDAFLQKNGVMVYLIVVQQQRSLSHAVAEWFHIKHESPQVLCIRDEKITAVYNHYDITETNLEHALG